MKVSKNHIEKRNEDMPKKNISETIFPSRLEIGDSMLRVTRCRYRPAVHPWELTHISPPNWRLYYNATPGGFFQTGSGKPEPFLPDRFYIFPKGYTFRTWSEQPFRHFYIHFTLYDQIPCPQRHFELPATQDILHLIDECINTALGWQDIQRRTMLAYAITGTLLSRLPPDLFRLHHTPDPRIEQIRELIENNLRRKFSNEELAERVNLAKNSFIRLFREKTGYSPQQYRLQKCMEFACGELHYSMRTIDEIAEETGFSDRFHFSRAFGKIMSMPPATYRRITRSRSMHYDEHEPSVYSVTD